MATRKIGYAYHKGSIRSGDLVIFGPRKVMYAVKRPHEGGWAYGWQTPKEYDEGYKVMGVEFGLSPAELRKRINEAFDIPHGIKI